MEIDRETIEKLLQEVNLLGMDVNGANGLIIEAKQVLCQRRIQAACARHLNIVDILREAISPEEEEPVNEEEQCEKTKTG